MQITTSPYELLVRWNTDGILTGASYSTLTKVSENGATVFERINDPVPVGLGADDPVTVAQVLSPAQLDAVAAVNLIAVERDALALQVATLTAERDALAAQLAAVTAERDALAAS